MSVILRNDYGAIAVNKGVIERMIIDDLLDIGDEIILCTKKGKPIKDKPARFYDPSRFTDPDYFDAVEVYEKKQQVRVKVFIITAFGSSISELTDEIFRRIENDFSGFVDGNAAIDELFYNVVAFSGKNHVVSGIAVFQQLSGVNAAELVAFQINFCHEAAGGNQKVGQQEIARHIARGVFAVRHIVAQRFQRYAVPCVDIDLLRLLGEVEGKGVVDE